MISPNRPRLVDVARLAGVSTATASRALSNPDVVAEDTRKAVQSAAASCGYKINLVARSLRTHRSQTLLVLVPGIDNNFYPEIISGLETGALERGYSMILGFTGKDEAREQAYLELLNARRADGLIVVDDGLRSLNPQMLPPDVPTVHLLEAKSGRKTAAVHIDDEAAAFMATRHLLDLGHRRIAHVSGRPSSEAASRRCTGYQRALATAGICADPGLVLGGSYDLCAGYEAAASLLALTDPPTAVFCANDSTAIGVLRHCKEQGRRVPQTMSVVGFDDVSDAALTDPPLTTIRQPRHQIGLSAIGAVMDIIDGRKDVVRDVILPHELVVRQSTAPPPHS
ncbi:MAG: LacI family DNA-binding transcriptional regulator [Alphaproteobacteria bacterium]|nr:LacI family DNA-binding transcriptional regulator [Alphaproteobacteria bacterium]